MERLAFRMVKRKESELKLVTIDDVFDGVRIHFPVELIQANREQLQNETDEEYNARWRSIREMADPLLKKYDLEWNSSAEGGFMSDSYEDLRFTTDRIIGSHDRVTTGFRLSRVSPESENGQRLLQCGVDYINGLIELYNTKPWRQE